jgi:uncharacterized membrane protein YbhN (UPF0104 family)
MLSLNDIRVLTRSACLSVAAWAIAYLIFVCFFAAAGHPDIGLLATLVIFVASTFGLIVAVAPGGLGTFEAAIVMSLVAYDVSTKEALTLAVLMRLCLVLPVVATAVWFLLTSEVSLLRLLRQIVTRKAKS